MKAKLRISYPGDTQIQVFVGRSKEPHFIISGTDIENIDRTKVNEYLNAVDWSDRHSPAYIIPTLRCDDFMKD